MLLKPLLFKKQKIFGSLIYSFELVVFIKNISVRKADNKNEILFTRDLF